MTGTRKYFGTDGIRGEVGRSPITVDFILKLGWAAGSVLAGGGHGKVIIGKDTRISGYMFESALEAGLTAAGTDVMLLGPIPTPAVAYLTRTLHATAGIVISASHNSYSDNGVKFFSGDGTKLSDDAELEIEKAIDSAMETAAAPTSARRSGSATRRAGTSSSARARCRPAWISTDSGSPSTAPTAPPTMSRRACFRSSAPR